MMSSMAFGGTPAGLSPMSQTGWGLFAVVDESLRTTRSSSSLRSDMQDASGDRDVCMLAMRGITAHPWVKCWRGFK
jgi:hypothetical protein